MGENKKRKALITNAKHRCVIDNIIQCMQRLIAGEQWGQRILKVLTCMLASSSPRPKHSITRSQLFLHGQIVLHAFATIVNVSNME